MNIMLGFATTPEEEPDFQRVRYGLEWLGASIVDAPPTAPYPGQGYAWTPLGYIVRQPYPDLANRPSRHLMASVLWWAGDIVWPNFRRPLMAIRQETHDYVRQLEHRLVKLDGCSPNIITMPSWASDMALSHLVCPIRVGWGTDEVYTDDSVRLLVDDGVGKIESLCGWPVVSVPSNENPDACQILSWRNRAIVNKDCQETIIILEELGFEVMPIQMSNLCMAGYGLHDITLKISA